MQKYYLISWDDDNHSKLYWLNNKILGTEMKFICEKLIDLEIPKGTELKVIDITFDTFPEEYWEVLGDYFNTIPTLDETDVRLIALDKWEDFYKKNIKKIMRKGLTN